MKTRVRLMCAAAVAPMLLLSSCVYPYYGGPHEASGGVAGALIGAAAGGIIGHQSCSGLEGALIGGVLGSVVGSAVGYSQDRYYYGYPPPPPVVVRPYYGSYYSGGYYSSCGPRYYSRPYRSHCW
jgi:hypothetical protein